MRRKFRKYQGTKAAGPDPSEGAEVESNLETLDILSDHPFYKRLRKSIQEARNGETRTSWGVRKPLGV